jgi:hypothetical protein
VTRLAVAALALAARATGRAPQHSPRDLDALSGPLAGLAFLGGLVTGVAVADDPYPRPGTKPARVRRYFQANTRAARISATGQLASAALLARFTATEARLARKAGSRRTLPAATTAAGAAAAASLATSGAISLALTGHVGARKATAAVLHRRLFIAGGPIHTAAFGVLVGCLSLAGRRSGRLPPALSAAGLASATAGVLSPLGLGRHAGRAADRGRTDVRPTRHRHCRRTAQPHVGHRRPPSVDNGLTDRVQMPRAIPRAAP